MIIGIDFQNVLCVELLLNWEMERLCTEGNPLLKRRVVELMRIQYNMYRFHHPTSIYSPSCTLQYPTLFKNLRGNK